MIQGAMNRRSNLLPYLLLNILVSAVTTLAVLWIWDTVHNSNTRAAQDVPPLVLAQNTENSVAKEAATLYAAGTRSAASTRASAGGGAGQDATERSSAPATTAAPTIAVETPQPIETLPPAGQPVIQIVSGVGAGDLDQEVVMLKRVGEGNLSMVGWKLQGERENTYVFPQQPELILYKDGAVQVYTKAGTDTVTEVYWNRTESAWRSGELIRLLDPQGIERASYRVP